MNTLKAVSGKINKKRMTWCGPAAISIITGCGYDAALELLKQVTGRSVIKGVARPDMFRALRRLGYDCKSRQEFTDWRPTLAWWLRQRESDEMSLTYLVNVTGHYLVVRGRKIADNKTGEPVFTRKYPHRRKRVKVVWQVAKATQ